MAAGHTLSLLYGTSKNSPTRTLSLSSTSSTGNLFLMQMSPAAGKKEIQYSPTIPGRDGVFRLNSQRENAKFEIHLNMRGDSAPQLRNLQEQLSRFIDEARQWHENRVGAKIWLKYRWADNLSELSNPVYGLSLDRYLEILDFEIPKWPDLHRDATIITGNIPGVVCELTTAPYTEALEIEAMAGTSVPGYETGVTFSASEMAAQCSVVGWVQHRSSDYVVWEYYIDATHYIRLEWDESDSRFEITHNTGGGAATFNCTVTTPAVNDWIHLSFYQDGSNRYVRQNGTQVLSGSYNAWGNGGVFKLGNATSVGTTAITALDAWRVWNDDLTGAQSDYFYTNELPIKTASQTIAPAVYCRTRTTRQIDAVDGVVSAAAADNYAVVANVPGDAPAMTRIEFDPPTSGATLVRGFWLSRNAQDSTYTPLGSSFLDFSGTADSGTSSGDAYEAGSGGNVLFDATVTSPAAIRGDVVFVGRLRIQDATGGVGWPWLQYGLSEIIRFGDGVTLTPSSLFQLYRLGTMRVDWPQTTTPPTVKAGLYVESESSSTLLAKCLAWWSFNETGGVAFDRVGKNHLTEVGTVSRNTPGKIGAAMADFSGSDYFWTPGEGLAFGDEDFSISLWINMDSLATDRVILAKYIGANYSREYLLSFNATAVRFRFAVGSGADGGASVTTVDNSIIGGTGSAVPSVDTWYHIVCQHDATSNIIRIVVNNGGGNSAAHSTGVHKGITPLMIGAASDGGTPVDGQFDALGIFRGRITDAEIATLFNSGNGREWPFTSTNTNVDFINILTEPAVEIRGNWSTIASGDTVAVEGMEAYVKDASDSDSQLLKMDYIGSQPLTVLPNKYNYISMLIGATGDQYIVTRTVTNFKVWVTPRWHLP